MRGWHFLDNDRDGIATCKDLRNRPSCGVHWQDGEKVRMMNNADFSYGNSTFDMKDIRRPIGRSSRKRCVRIQVVTKNYRTLVEGLAC